MLFTLKSILTGCYAKTDFNRFIENLNFNYKQNICVSICSVCKNKPKPVIAILNTLQYTHLNYPVKFFSSDDIVYDTHQEIFIKDLLKTVPKWITHCVLNKNEITVYITPDCIIPFFFFLKNHVYTQFKMLIDVTA